ncbi:MAG: cytochrome c biogenesis protein ResB [Nitrospiraceae bacterium]|nr:cytochrome c biogenesis protein ResB [Nitrospiraceae bacterium]
MEERESKKETLSDKVWSFFSSIKLAIVVFSLIALTSIVGTILEQNAAPEVNMRVLSHLVGISAAPMMYRILDAMDFMNMYRSWWFLSLLALFAANLMVCSIDRFPGIWKLVKAPAAPMPPEAFRGAQIKAEVKFGGKGQPADVAREAFKKIGFAPHEHSSGDEVQIYAQKHAWSRLGVYITHVSIIVIMIGAVAGKWFGFKGVLSLPEGETATVAYRDQQMGSQAQADAQQRLMDLLEATNSNLPQLASALNVSQNQLAGIMKSLGIYPLGFALRCDNFNVDFYGDTDQPKAYKSKLTVIDDGKEVLTKQIEVNKPLKYKGVTVYQSSYGQLDNFNNGVAILDAKGPGGASETMRLKIGESIKMPGTGAKVKLVDFNPALAFDESGRPYAYAHMMNNPAVEVQITSGDTKAYKWILKRYPQTWSLGDGSILKLKEFWGVQYTGLQVRRDPGVWIVYLGCLMLGLGLFVAFFMSHRRIWVRIVNEKGGAKAVIAASANKNRYAFERQIEKLKAHLAEGGK